MNKKRMEDVYRIKGNHNIEDLILHGAGNTKIAIRDSGIEL